jgi:hypothetical protein
MLCNPNWFDQDTSTAAALCFAVHYNCLATAESSLGTADLISLSRVSYHCLCALRRQIAPTVFAHWGPDLYGRVQRVEQFLALWRFAQFTRQDAALWCASFMRGLCRFYVDDGLPHLACRLLMETMRSVRHTRDERCGNYCALCPIEELLELVDETNESGEVLCCVMDERPVCPSFDRVHRHEEVYRRDADLLVAKLALALQAIGTGCAERDRLTRAMQRRCQQCITAHLEEWLTRLVDTEHDLILLLDCPADSMLYASLYRALSTALNIMPLAALNERVAFFFARYVHCEEEWLKWPRHLHLRLETLAKSKKDRRPTLIGDLHAVFRLRALTHLCESNEQYDTEQLTRILADQMYAYEDEARTIMMDGESIGGRYLGLAVEALVRILERRDAQNALALLYVPPPEKRFSLVALVAQRKTAAVDEQLRVALTVDVLAQSCDPLEIFMYHGVNAVPTVGQAHALQQYLDSVLPVIGVWGLQELCEFLQQANAVFRAHHWLPTAIPVELRQLLACRYGLSVLALQPPSVDALHRVWHASQLCMGALVAIDAFSPDVCAWLAQACEVFIKEAQRRMYQPEWRCACGREYGDCVPQAVALCEPMGGDHPLCFRLRALEGEYVDTLLRQEFMLTGEAHDVDQ